MEQSTDDIKPRTEHILCDEFFENFDQLFNVSGLSTKSTAEEFRNIRTIIFSVFDIILRKTPELKLGDKYFATSPKIFARYLDEILNSIRSSIDDFLGGIEEGDGYDYYADIDCMDKFFTLSHVTYPHLNLNFKIFFFFMSVMLDYYSNYGKILKIDQILESLNIIHSEFGIFFNSDEKNQEFDVDNYEIDFRGYKSYVSLKYIHEIKASDNILTKSVRSSLKIFPDITSYLFDEDPSKPYFDVYKTHLKITKMESVRENLKGQCRSFIFFEYSDTTFSKEDKKPLFFDHTPKSSRPFPKFLKPSSLCEKLSTLEEEKSESDELPYASLALNHSDQRLLDIASLAQVDSGAQDAQSLEKNQKFQKYISEITIPRLTPSVDFSHVEINSASGTPQSLKDIEFSMSQRPRTDSKHSETTPTPASFSRSIESSIFSDGSSNSSQSYDRYVEFSGSLYRKKLHPTSSTSISSQISSVEYCAGGEEKLQELRDKDSRTEFSPAVSYDPRKQLRFGEEKDDEEFSLIGSNVNLED